MWISPLEVINIHAEKRKGGAVTYQEMLIGGKGGTKLKNQEDLPMKLDWFQYKQLKNYYEFDKNKFGFKEKNSEEILLKNDTKLISKVYKLLLKWFTEEEMVKN